MHRLDAELQRIYKNNSAVVEKAKKDGATSAAIDDLRHELVQEAWAVEDQISLAKSRRLGQTRRA